VVPAKKEELEEISSYLGNAEITTKFASRRKIVSFSRDIEENILSTLKRRPCTAEDLSQVLGLHLNEITKYLQALLEIGKIETEEQERGIFFKIKGVPK
jgi:DNA-binding transcriptional ArsR family regulator